jgi:hypothetical protein
MPVQTQHRHDNADELVDGRTERSNLLVQPRCHRFIETDDPLPVQDPDHVTVGNHSAVLPQVSGLPVDPSWLPSLHVPRAPV